MGGQVSVPQRAKEEQLDMYGPFSLRQSQKYRLNVFSDLINLLIREEGNNLFNLSKVLNSQNRCQSLITVIADRLNKEFTTLLFPDPKHGSASSLVGFMTEDDYRAKFKNDGLRQLYCSKFAFFIVRITALLAALVASVAYQKNVYLSDSAQSVPPPNVNQTYKNLADTSLHGEPISSDIIRYFESTGALKRIQGDSRNLYVFGGMDSVVLDIDKGIVYNARNNVDTGVLRINIFRPLPDATGASTVAGPAPVQAPVQVPARPCAHFKI